MSILNKRMGGVRRYFRPDDWQTKPKTADTITAENFTDEDLDQAFRNWLNQPGKKGRPNLEVLKDLLSNARLLEHPPEVTKNGLIELVEKNAVRSPAFKDALKTYINGLDLNEYVNG